MTLGGRKFRTGGQAGDYIICRISFWCNILKPCLKDYEIVDSVSVHHSGQVTVLPRLLRDNLKPSAGINIIEVSLHDELH